MTLRSCLLGSALAGLLLPRVAHGQLPPPPAPGLSEEEPPPASLPPTELPTPLLSAPSQELIDVTVTGARGLSLEAIDSEVLEGVPRPNWSQVCTLPCRSLMPRRQRLRVGWPRNLYSYGFTLPQDATHVELEARTPKRSVYWGGLTSVVVGAGALGLGVLTMLFNIGNPAASPLYVGASFTGVGGALGVVGGILMAAGRPRLRLVDLQRSGIPPKDM